MAAASAQEQRLDAATDFTGDSAGNSTGNSTGGEKEAADNAPAAGQGTGFENEIYTKRFSPRQEQARRGAWDVLVPEFFQQFVRPTDTVVDLGAGDGHFITRIDAARRIAVDLSPHVRELSSSAVEVYQVLATDFVQHTGRDSVDVVFMSNFLEHLPEKKILLDVLAHCREALKPGGKLLILQPNIRYVGPAYWDYIDHHIALTEHSLVEALEITGYKIQRLIPRFLPYTAKSALGGLAAAGDGTAAVRTYLRWPILWRIFGKQTFVAAIKD